MILTCATCLRLKWIYPILIIFCHVVKDVLTLRSCLRLLCVERGRLPTLIELKGMDKSEPISKGEEECRCAESDYHIISNWSESQDRWNASPSIHLGREVFEVAGRGGRRLIVRSRRLCLSLLKEKALCASIALCRGEMKAPCAEMEMNLMKYIAKSRERCCPIKDTVRQSNLRLGVGRCC